MALSSAWLMSLGPPSVWLTYTVLGGASLWVLMYAAPSPMSLVSGLGILLPSVYMWYMCWGGLCSGRGGGGGVCLGLFCPFQFGGGVWCAVMRGSCGGGGGGGLEGCGFWCGWLLIFLCWGAEVLECPGGFEGVCWWW